MTTKSVPWMVPYPQLSCFTGRAKVLHDLQAALIEKGTALLTHHYAFSGLGGLGKTQTAVAFAHRNRDLYRGVFWIRGDSDWTLTADYMHMARLLGWHGTSNQNWKDAIQFALHWLAENRDWLLILDNVEKPEKLAEWIPAQVRGHVFITSRLQNFETLLPSQIIELEELQQEEALRFLFKRTGRLDTDSLERKSAGQLSQRLGGIPLGLEWAGAYVTAHDVSFRDYLTFLKLPEEPNPPPPVGSIRETMVSVFKRNLDHVKQTSEASYELLQASAYLYPDTIPFELLTHHSDAWGPTLGPLLIEARSSLPVLENILAPLYHMALASPNPEHGGHKGYQIHSFTQDLVKTGIGQDQRRQWANRVIHTVHAAIHKENRDQPALVESLLPQIHAATKLIHEGMMESQETGLLLRHFGLLVHERFQFAKAEPFFKGSISVLETALGIQHAEVASGLHDLACRYKIEGRYAEAEQFFKRSLMARETRLGRDHKDIALYLHELGTHYDEIGKSPQADRLFTRSLQIREQTLGTTHQDIGTYLYEVACRYISHGQFSEGDKLFERALTIGEDHLGRNHPQVGHQLLEFANLCAEQGRYQEAEPLLKRSLAIARKEIQRQDPRFSTYLLSLARLHHALNRPGQAEALYQEALEVMEPLDHPDIAATLNNLGGLFHEQKKYGKAEPFLRRALSKARTLLAPDHPNIATCLNNVAAACVAIRKYAEAEPLFAEALTIRQRHLPEHHPSLLGLLDNYALLLRRLKRQKEASHLEAQAATIRATMNT